VPQAQLTFFRPTFMTPVKNWSRRKWTNPIGECVRSTFGATITIPVIASANGTIDIFHDHIHDPCKNWSRSKLNYPNRRCVRQLLFLSIWSEHPNIDMHRPGRLKRGTGAIPLIWRPIGRALERWRSAHTLWTWGWPRRLERIISWLFWSICCEHPANIQI